MARILVVIGGTKPGWSTRRLVTKLKNMGHQVGMVQPSSLAAVTERGKVRLLSGGVAVEPDAAIIRGLGFNLNAEQLASRLAILAAIEARGTPVVNPWLALFLARSKPLSTVILASRGLPVPPSISSESLGALLKFAENKRTVVKPVMGSLGLGSFLAEDVDQLYHYASLLLSLSRPVYAQEYIEKRLNSDIRAFVVDSRVIAAARRIAPPGSWKTNVARGGRVEPVKLEPDVEEIAVKAAEALGLLYAGVDIAEARDGAVYILEVNATPNWRGLYRATGIDPAEEIAGLVSRLLKGR